MTPTELMTFLMLLTVTINPLRITLPERVTKYLLYFETFQIHPNLANKNLEILVIDFITMEQGWLHHFQVIGHNILRSIITTVFTIPSLYYWYLPILQVALYPSLQAICLKKKNKIKQQTIQKNTHIIASFATVWIIFATKKCRARATGRATTTA